MLVSVAIILTRWHACSSEPDIFVVVEAADQNKNPAHYIQR